MKDIPVYPCTATIGMYPAYLKNKMTSWASPQPFALDNGVVELFLSKGNER